MGDREKAYDEHISPLVAKIIDLCQEHQIQMVMSFDVDEPDKEDGRMLCTSALLDAKFGNVTPSLDRALSIILGESPLVAAFTISTAGDKES